MPRFPRPEMAAHLTSICGYCEYEWSTDSGRQVCIKCGNDGDIEGHVVRDELLSREENVGLLLGNMMAAAVFGPRGEKRGAAK